ncbi:unnamed protein product [Cutaneotrichosporon oleaginosum]
MTFTRMNARLRANASTDENVARTRVARTAGRRPEISRAHAASNCAGKAGEEAEPPDVHQWRGAVTDHGRAAYRSETRIRRDAIGQEGLGGTERMLSLCDAEGNPKACADVSRDVTYLVRVHVPNTPKSAAQWPRYAIRRRAMLLVVGTERDVARRRAKAAAQVSGKSVIGSEMMVGSESGSDNDTGDTHK